MIQCINNECKFKEYCMTYTEEGEEKVKHITPKFEDECEYYFNIWDDLKLENGEEVKD